MNMKIERPFAILSLLFASLVISSVTCKSETLPPEAQEVMKKGLLAVEQQEWSLAIRYFEEARKAAPQSPEILFNLGLAESKLPAREFRSIAWFKAYLTMLPDAPNAQAVLDMMDRLNIKAEGTIMKLVNQGRQMSLLFPEESRRNGAQCDIGIVLAKIGDSQGAKQCAIIIGPSDNGDIVLKIAVALAENGDIPSAKEVLELIDSKTSTIYRSSASADIASFQAESGDISGAMSTVDDYDDDTGWGKYRGLIAIAEAMHKAGRTDEARNILIRARINTQKVSKGIHSISDVGIAQAHIGDIKGAVETASMIEDSFYRNRVYTAIEITKELLKSAAPDTTEKLEKTKELEVRKKKVEKWIHLLEESNELYQPIFTDLQTHIQSLNSKSSAIEIFDGLIGAAEKMANMLITFKKIDKGID